MAILPTLERKTAVFNPAVFNPIEYNPMTVDYSILDKSMQQQEERQKEAVKQQSALNVALSQVEDKLHNDPTTNQWWADYKNNIQTQLDAAASRGDYASAINDAVRLAGEVTSDTSLSSRIKSNTQYQSKVDEVHKLRQDDKITKDTEDWWNDTHPYDYKDVLDNNGKVIGGTDYSNLEIPVRDIDPVNLAQLAMKLITPNKTSNQWQTGDITGKGKEDIIAPEGTIYRSTSAGSYQIEEIKEKDIVKNLKEIFRQIPGAQAAMNQRYQVELHTLKKLQEQYNNLISNSNPTQEDINNAKDLNTRINNIKKLTHDNLGNADFETFCSRLIGESAITHGMAYKYVSTSSAKDFTVASTPSKKKGSGDDDDDEIQDINEQQSVESVLQETQNNTNPAAESAAQTDKLEQKFPTQQ